MLLFIAGELWNYILQNKISIHLMLLFISDGALYSAIIGSFQYISCYCLSHKNAHGGKLWTIFQYISCYCLSLPDLPKRVNHLHISIHLMLLFIGGSWSLPKMHRNFNTSHVTVYPDSCWVFSKRNYISIHLMLLFIFFPFEIFSRMLDFNTSHVTVYLLA